MDDDGAGDDDDFLPVTSDLLHDGSGLADGSFDLALRRDLIAHEGEAVAVAFLGLRDDADSAHPDHDGVAGLEVAKTAADGPFGGEDYHGIHALAIDAHPIVIDADFGAVISGGVEVFGCAGVLFDDAGFGVPIFGGGATKAEELAEETVHLLAVGGFNFEAEMGGIGVGAADLEDLNFEAALKLDDGVEDPFHDVRVDEVSVGLNRFLERKRLRRRFHASLSGYRLNPSTIKKRDP